MLPDLPKLYISIDGADGVGKTSIIEMLKPALSTLAQEFGYSGVHYTKQPGGQDSIVTVRLREMCLDPAFPMSPLTNELLFLADFTENMTAVKQALDKCMVVVTDRGFLTHYVYACARGLADPWYAKTLFAISHGIIPDMTFVITCLVEKARERKAGVKEEFGQPDKMEVAGWQFQRVVASVFEDMVYKIGMWHELQLEGIVGVPNNSAPACAVEVILTQIHYKLLHNPRYGLTRNALKGDQG